MAEVYRSDVIAAPVERVWAVVRDFNALPVWTPFVADSRIEGGGPSDRIGCVRAFRLRDGGTIRERLLGLDDRDHSCRYAILEADMAVENYVAKLRLMRVSDGNRTFAEWAADFDCSRADEPGLVRLIGDEVFASGLAALRRRFAPAPGVSGRFAA